jgi:hypothetical protein
VGSVQRFDWLLAVFHSLQRAWRVPRFPNRGQNDPQICASSFGSLWLLGEVSSVARPIIPINDLLTSQNHSRMGDKQPLFVITPRPVRNGHTSTQGIPLAPLACSRYPRPRHQRSLPSLPSVGTLPGPNPEVMLHQAYAESGYRPPKEGDGST